jgi:hypothetical protein
MLNIKNEVGGKCDQSRPEKKQTAIQNGAPLKKRRESIQIHNLVSNN